MTKRSRSLLALAIFVVATAACGSTNATDGETTMTPLDPSAVDGGDGGGAVVVGDAAPYVSDAANTAADAGAPVVVTPPVTTGDLRVRIEGLGDTSGQLAWALFDEAHSGDFSDGTPLRAERITIPSTSFELSFNALTPGRYAVVVYHDKDKNDKLNKGVFGQPVEPWGSTNNVTHTFSGPTFDESAVDVAKGFRTSTKILMHD